jgi:hypothetical protein
MLVVTKMRQVADVVRGQLRVAEDILVVGLQAWTRWRRVRNVTVRTVE